MDQNDLPVDDVATAFPASENTPGQAKSRNAYQRFLDLLREKQPAWQDHYQQLRAEKIDWRKAIYIAWAASPKRERWPKTQQELAIDVLGLTNDRTIQKWRENDPDLDARVEKFRTGLFAQHLTDIIETSIEVALQPTTTATAERKMIFEITGIYKPKSAVAMTGENGGPVQVEDVGITDEERAGRVMALLESARARRDRSVAEDGHGDLEAATGAADDGVLQPGA